MTPEMWALLRAKTNVEVLAEARADPDALPIEDRPPGSVGPTGRMSPVKRIRWKLGLSQTKFSAAFGIPLGTTERLGATPPRAGSGERSPIWRLLRGTRLPFVRALGKVPA